MTYYLKFANAFVLVSVTLLFVLISSVLSADPLKLDRLLQELKMPTERSSREIEIEIWAEWSRSGSERLDSFLQLGRYHMANQNLDEAIKLFDILINDMPNFAEGWNARATAYYLQGRYEKSISDIDRVLNLNPYHFGALSGLGSIFESLGKFESALNAFRKANEINPTNTNIKNSLDRLRKKVNGIFL